MITFNDFRAECDELRSDHAEILQLRRRLQMIDRHKFDGLVNVMDYSKDGGTHSKDPDAGTINAIENYHREKDSLERRIAETELRRSDIKNALESVPGEKGVVCSSYYVDGIKVMELSKTYFISRDTAYEWIKSALREAYEIYVKRK